MSDKHTRSQLQTIARKFLLGDDAAQQILEEQGPQAADARARAAAARIGLCPCMRSDGVLCGKQLIGEKADSPGALCWPCWSRAKDGKRCDHTRGGADDGGMGQEQADG